MRSKEQKIIDLIVKRWCSGVGRISFYDFPQLYKKIISKYEFEIDEIEQYPSLIDWEALSENERIDWSLEFIEKHKDAFDWYYISNNKGIEFNEVIIENFKDKLSLTSLISSKLINVNKEFIIKYKDFIGHSIMDLFQREYASGLDYYTTEYEYLLDFEVIDAFSTCITDYGTIECYIDWKKLSMVEKLVNNRIFLLRYREKLYWNYICLSINLNDFESLSSFLLEFNNELVWSDLYYNKCCQLFKDEIEAKFPGKLRSPWAEMRKKEYLLRKMRKEDFEEFLKEEKGNEIDWEKQKYYPNGKLTLGETKRMLHDPNQFWDEELLENSVNTYRHIYTKGDGTKVFPWYEFSEKTNVNWNSYLLNKYKNYLDWSRISENQSIIWDGIMIGKFKKYIDWHKISKNQSIIWDELMIERFKKYIYWFKIFTNPSIEWNTKLLMRYKGYLNFNDDQSPIYNSNKIKWDATMLNTLRKYINWVYLLYNTEIVWTKEMIYSNKYYWFNAFLNGIDPEYQLKINWDLTILSKIVDWSTFLRINRFSWSYYDIDKVVYKKVSWLDCIIPYLTLKDIERLANRLEYHKIKENEYYNELEEEEEFCRFYQDEMDKERELYETDLELERDSFNEMTDGQYGSYDDWKERGKDIDDLKDRMGR